MAERVISLSENSRYRNTPIFSGDGAEFGKNVGKIDFRGHFVPPEIDEKNSDTFITIKSKDNGRLDLLANQYYGTPELWWAIALVNNIFDPTYGVETGTVIRIPPLQSIFSNELIEGF